MGTVPDKPGWLVTLPLWVPGGQTLELGLEGGKLRGWGRQQGDGNDKVTPPPPAPSRDTLPQLPHSGRNNSFKGGVSIQGGQRGSGQQLVVWLGKDLQGGVGGQKGRLDSGRGRP